MGLACPFCRPWSLVPFMMAWYIAVSEPFPVIVGSCSPSFYFHPLRQGFCLAEVPGQCFFPSPNMHSDPAALFPSLLFLPLRGAACYSCLEKAHLRDPPRPGAISLTQGKAGLMDGQCLSRDVFRPTVPPRYPQRSKLPVGFA